MIELFLTWCILSASVFHMPWNPMGHYSWNIFPELPIRMWYNVGATKLPKIDYTDRNDDLSEGFVIRSEENIQMVQPGKLGIYNSVS